MKLKFHAKNYRFDLLLARARGDGGDPADGDAARELYVYFADRLGAGDRFSREERLALAHALRRLATYYSSLPGTVTPVTAFMPNDRPPIAAAGSKPISHIDEWRKVSDRVDDVLMANPGMKRTTAMRHVASENMRADGIVLRTEDARKTALAKYLKRVKRDCARFEAARNPSDL